MASNKKQPLELISILGPTATGKTGLAVQLANQLNGEIISADSRQIYRGMDIGTGKDLEEYSLNGKQIPYHLIDILDPTDDYNVCRFQTEFQTVYKAIHERKKLPILCGGTGLYLDSVLLNYRFEPIDANTELRENLESKSMEELVTKLRNLDPKLFENWNIDTKRRVIRGIELAMGNGNPEINSAPDDLSKTCVLGVHYPREIIRERITSRLNYRLDNGMIEEVKELLKNGLPKERLNYFGLEYKFIRQFLDDEITKDDLFKLLNIAIHQFAKRQSTWFRRMEKRGVNIHWINRGDVNLAMEILEERFTLS
ncbi:MAG: tRNA (adenosine(37)-N6)-dimethylallyltransferase MiaA [Candidatus Marinimicrobia bacterium]|nr:tRNA (adenosine(37)-N6)-dimethylallyltransferase MiaA [Candidatus Neomarinimicrobiota bacterium]